MEKAKEEEEVVEGFMEEGTAMEEEDTGTEEDMDMEEGARARAREEEVKVEVVKEAVEGEDSLTSTCWTE